MKLNNISGYDILSEKHQKLFEDVYAKHMSVIEDKSRWIPVSVKWIKSYLKVTFTNGDWLHYTPQGTRLKEEQKMNMKGRWKYVVAIVLGLLITPSMVIKAEIQRGYRAVGGEILIVVVLLLIVLIEDTFKQMWLEYKRGEEYADQ